MCQVAKAAHYASELGGIGECVSSSLTELASTFEKSLRGVAILQSMAFNDVPSIPRLA